VQLGQLSVLAAALFYATSNVLTKRLVVTDTPLAILLYMSLVQFPLGLVAGIPGWSWPSPSLWIWIFLVGVGGMSAHYCLARALKLADASVVAPMGFLRLPLSALIGFLAYTEAIDLWVVVGALVIFLGNYFNIRTEAQSSQ
jgi:drug/metabolite transporter (DMT)-like permease